MKYLMEIVKIIPVSFILLVGEANASIILSNINNDLLLEIENPITFEVSTAKSTSRLGFLIPGAIDFSGSGGFLITSDAATEPDFIGPDFFSSGPGVGHLRSNQDLEILYFLSDTVDLSIGDLVILTVGSLVLPNFFDFGIVNGLNFNIATEAILSATGGVPISEPTPTVIPIPGTVLLFSSAIILFLTGTRRRN